MKGIIDFQAERYREITSKVDEVVELIKTHGAPEGLEPEHCIVTYALNKLKEEIAAMEKQPEYEYDLTVYVEAWCAIKDFEGGEKLFKEVDGAYIEITHVQEVLSLHLNECLYRRVEIKPEQKREREVEELAKEVCKRDSERDSQDFKERWDFSGELYKSIVSTVLNLKSKE